MPGPVIEGGNSIVIPAAPTGVPIKVIGGAGFLMGVFCSTVSSGTLEFTDRAGVTIVPSYAPNAAAYHPHPIRFENEIWVRVNASVTGCIITTHA